MSYEKVTKMQSRLIIGNKQTRKAINRDEVREVYIAQDADEILAQEIIQIASDRNIAYYMVDSMKKLGTACGIEVPASAVAVKK